MTAREKRTFQQSARLALADTQLRANLGQATQTIRSKRAEAVAELPDWEALRDAGQRLKARTLRHLDHYLLEFESAVERADGKVHWARDADEANRIVVSLVQRHGEREVIKAKSLTTDEIELNAALARAGITATETDFAELVLQLDGDWSSHLLVPAIHRNRAEIRNLFLRTIADGLLSDDPVELVEVARRYLREKFLSVRIGISGANFAVAETGTVCLVESEGNARMCTTLPSVVIAVVGIEKIIPTVDDLEVYLQLLPRSATGERMNPYTSLWTGSGSDGPEEFHVVLLDNGRTNVLADDVGRDALACIRCGACLNVCPVYSRVGGHAYNSIYPGPIGAILTPQLRGVAQARSLPYASSLCGACYVACPVKIDIPRVLVHLRGTAVRQDQSLGTERMAMRTLAWVMRDRRRYERAQRLARVLQRPLVHDGRVERLPGPLGGWTVARDMRPVPRESFRMWWRTRRNNDDSPR